MVIFTTSALNYLPKALRLAASIQDSGIDALLAICLPERRKEVPKAVTHAFDRVIFPDELGLQHLDSFMFRHKLIEAATALKARLFLYLMALYPSEDAFIFLDPDISVFSDMTDCFSTVSSGSVFLTPHLVAEEINPERIGRSFWRVLNGGIFNTGFVGIRRSLQSITFLHWWQDRLDTLCYEEVSKGLFVDQKWVDFALGFMSPSIIRDRGYNIGWWNLPCRPLGYKDKILSVGSERVRFIHFSGLCDQAGLSYHLASLDPSDPIHSISSDYLKQLSCVASSETYSMYPWSYGHFNSGEEVRFETRIAFRRSTLLRERFPLPFGFSNEVILAALVDEV